MSQSLPWNIEDLEPETRDAARRAARAAGMSVDEWLEMTMRDQENTSRRAPRGYHDEYEDDHMARDMARMGRGRTETASHHFAPSRLSQTDADALLAKAASSDRRAREAEVRTAEMLESITRWMEKTENRIVAGEKNSSERQERTASVMADAIKTVGTRLNDVERRTGDERRAYPELRSTPERRTAPQSMAAPALSKANFADAVAEIRARQRDLDDNGRASPRHSAHETRDRGSDNRGSDPGIRALRDELRSLSTNFSDRAQRGAAQDDLRGELLKLRRDIAQGANRTNADMTSTLSALITKLDRQPRTSAGDQVSRSLARLESDVAKLASGRGTGGDAIERQIARLHQRLDQMGSGFDGKAIGTLSRELSEIKTKLGTVGNGDSRFGDDMNDRISAMAADLTALRRGQIDPVELAAFRNALEESQSSSTSTANKGVIDVLRQIETLSQRIDHMPGLSVDELDIRVNKLMHQFEAIKPAEHSATDDLSRRIETLAVKLDDMSQRAPAALEKRLDDIKSFLENAPAQGSAGLERQIESLAARLENLAASNGLVQVLASDGKPISADLRPIEKMLRNIQDRVNKFEQPDSSESFSELTRQIKALNDRAEPFGEISRQIKSLHDRAERPLPVVDLSPVENLLRGLQERLEKAQQPDAGISAINALERQISLLAKRIDDWAVPASDTGLDNTLRDLIATVDSMRHDGPSHAERAVKEAFESGFGRLKESQSGIETRIGTSFSSVQDAMERIGERLASLEKDGRTLLERPAYTREISTRDAPMREILVEERAALADALLLEPSMQNSPQRQKAQARSNQSVDASVMEAAIRAEGGRAELANFNATRHEAFLPEAAMNQPNAQDRGLQGPAFPQAEMPRQDMPRQDAARQDAARQDAAKQDIPQSSLSGLNLVDQPLEPGSGRPRGGAGSQGEPTAKADPQTIKANYIAAARRAVQAAAAEAKAASGDERSPKGARPTSPSKVKALFEKRKKPILLGLAAAILAMGSAQVISSVVLGGKTSSPEPKLAAANPEKSRNGVPVQDRANLERVSPERAVPKQELVAKAPAAPAQNAPSSILSPARSENQPAATVPAEAPQPNPAAAVAASIGPGAAIAAVQPGVAPATPSETLAGAATTVTGLPEIPVNIGSSGLRKAAMSGDPRAVFDLATRAADGRGMPRDPKLALKLLERAAAAGLVPAQFRVGNMYEKGVGTNKDAGIARLWYERSAEKGNSKAMHNLAVLYAEGVTGKPDYPLAAEWFRKAADHGVRDSQYNLAILLARGLGSAQDLTQSYVLFAAAAAQGDEDAGKKRDEVALKLSPSELATARTSAEQWRAKPVDLQANEVALPAKGWDEPVASPATPKKPVRNSQG